MTAIRVAIRRYALPFRRPFVTAAGTHTMREGFLLRVTAPDGSCGYGEAAPLPGHGGEPLDETRSALASLAAALTSVVAGGGALPADPEALRDLVRRLARAAPHAPAALAAFDLALSDLAARRAGLPLARWWDDAAREVVPVNAAIGAVPPDEAARLARARVEEGYRTLKLKVGTGVEDDVARVSAVRAAVGPGVALRADANGAWGEVAALEILRALAVCDLEYVEQPVPAEDIAALARIRRASPVPVAADESLAVPGGPERILADEAADVLILKPTLIGGPSRARALAERAVRRGMAAVVTTALDAAVGRMGALHLAAALPEAERGYARGLATGDLLAADVAPALRPRNGALAVPAGPGLGVDPLGDFEDL